MTRQRRITALNAVTATTTSNKFWVGGAKRIWLHYRAAAITSGNGAFTVKGSLEPFETGNGPIDAHNNPTGGNAITMSALNMLVDNVTNANTANHTRVNSKTLSSNGDGIVWLEPDILVNWLEATVTRTTDGTYSAWIVVEEELPQMAGS